MGQSASSDSVSDADDGGDKEQPETSMHASLENGANSIQIGGVDEARCDAARENFNGETAASTLSLDNGRSSSLSKKSLQSDEQANLVPHPVNGNKDDRNGETDDESRNSIDSCIAFLKRPPISSQEIEAVSDSIREAVDVALKKIEKSGKTAFDQFLEDEAAVAAANRESDDTKKKEQEQALKDAAIIGNPRDYQMALFEAAKKRNTIVNLGTGKGKTLIALLCIDHFSKSYEEGKQTLFMVPSVPLAIQQTTTLQANLPFTIQTACINVSNSEDARRALAEANIIVATHGAIHDLLMHYGDMFQMERFNLVVLDECHYASRNHQYKTIMNKFYHTLPKEKRPHVLGLTASPLSSVKHTHSDEQIGEMLATLETTLDAKVASLTDLMDEDTSELFHKPAVEKLIYFKSLDAPTGFPSHEDVIGMHQGRLREFRQLDALYHDLGPLPLALYCRTLIQEISCNSYEHETSDQFRQVVDHLEEIAKFCDEKVKESETGGRTEKMLKLEKLLEDQIEFDGGDDTVGLVFVERRVTAMAMQNYFRYRQRALDNGEMERARDVPCMQRELSSPVSFKDSDSDSQYPDDSMEAEPADTSSEVLPDQFEDPDDDNVVDLARVGFPVRTIDAMGETRKTPAPELGAHLFAPIPDQFADAEEDPFGTVGSDQAVTDATNSRRAASPMEVTTAALTQAQESDTQSVLSGQFSDADDDAKSLLEPGAVSDKAEPLDSLRCGVLVRQATQIFKYLHAGQKRKAQYHEKEREHSHLHQEMKIRQILNSLRRKEINLLIATSVVEEGVDVQA